MYWKMQILNFQQMDSTMLATWRHSSEIKCQIDQEFRVN